jgi:small subunit ribosomal protein S4
MSRDREPVCKRCRALNEKLFLKGERCYNDDKCSFKRRSYPPGQQGRFSRRGRNATEYAVQLREKQKARFIYGITETAFRNYFQKAVARRGVTGVVLFQLLERRLDNVVYRLGFGNSRDEARQLVRHRHITVNGHITDIPSYQVKTGDVIAVKDVTKKVQKVRDSANNAASRARIPAWLETNPLELRGTVLEIPDRDKLNIPVQEHLIVEFYSR